MRISSILQLAAESGDADAYQAYFQKKLKEWGVKSPAELDDAKKKKFFSEVDEGWTSTEEKRGKMKLSKMIRSDTQRSAGELDPHQKVRDLLTHTTKIWDYLNAVNKGLDLHVGDFYLKFPKAAMAKTAMEPMHKKLMEGQIAAFRALGILKKLDKLKE